MARWIALVGLVLSYRIADALCTRAAALAGGWVRAWLPPLVLLVACDVWLRQWPISAGSVPGRGVWAIRGLVGGLGCTIAVFACISAGPPVGSAPSGIETLALLTVVPLAEELLFRGVLLDHLRRSLGAPAAVLVVSVLFGWLHGTGATGAVMLVLSLLCCAAVLATRSLLWPVGVHVLWNGWTVVHRTSVAEGRIGLGLALGALACALAVGGSALKLKEA